MNKEIIHLAVCVALFILLRYLFGVVPVEMLDFLLFPVSKLVGFCLNSPGRFVEGAGYVHEGLQIIIERSCAGGNFLLISFLMTSWFFIHEKVLRSWLIIPGALLLSYLLTILANVGRITGYLVLTGKEGIPLVMLIDKHLLHTFTGVVVYLVFLILFYFILQKIVSNKKTIPHEEVA